MAGLINRPLKDLSIATGRVRAGDFEASRLDETVVTSEIRAVNVGFNRMTQKLAKVEEDRAVMLAGISHDLRTPLARLRLETELSVDDEQAREHMASDIAQIDAIIGKFLDYARPGSPALLPVSLNQTVEQAVSPTASGSGPAASGCAASPTDGAGRSGGADACDQQSAGKRGALWQISRHWLCTGGRFCPRP
jgi:two-component system osmolarity sensor histidine kinase EnvZ